MWLKSGKEKAFQDLGDIVRSVVGQLGLVKARFLQDVFDSRCPRWKGIVPKRLEIDP